ncbi:hypothetical protein Avbf_13058 [Armadillidium vulgare]|nr:hypothetical protein Avbf_13058 [Armadillidium vulgare]
MRDSEPVFLSEVMNLLYNEKEIKVETPFANMEGSEIQNKFSCITNQKLEKTLEFSSRYFDRNLENSILTKQKPIIGNILSTLWWLLSASVVLTVGFLHPPRHAAYLTPPAFLLILISHAVLTVPQIQARILACIASVVPIFSLLGEYDWTTKEILI